MAKAKKITQNINKDAGLLDMPKVRPGRSTWETRFSNYISSNIGDIVPVYCDEIMPDEKRRITMGMLSHMTTPIAPIFNAQYTEFRAFFVPHRLSADLLAGYKTRKSPFVKVFGEDNASANAQIVVPLAEQKLPNVGIGFATDFENINFNNFGGIFDALDLQPSVLQADSVLGAIDFNFLNLSAYELIYQKAYRNQNRESATESELYRFLFDAYNRSAGIVPSDIFHVAQREKDYFTGAQPFTQKGEPVTAGLVGNANIIADSTNHDLGSNVKFGWDSGQAHLNGDLVHNGSTNELLALTGTQTGTQPILRTNLVADLSSASGIDIETLRLMIKTQELLEKDMMYGSDYASSLNAHFGTAPISLILDEPLELKKVTITSQMQAIFQTSNASSDNETILGQIGANATTQSGDFEIVPETEFKEWGYLIICACHKAQNSYDSLIYKPKHIFKKARFDFFTPELDDLGYQPVTRKEFDAENYSSDIDEGVGFNEAWAEYRYKFNKVHGMLEPNRSNALDYWTLAIGSYSDIQSLYKQSKTELDRAVSVTSQVSPQFYDAYGFVEINTKPMKLHSIPGMDGVI